MTAVGGLVLALVCVSTVALALGITVATWGGRDPHWLTTTVRVFAVTLAGFCLILAALGQLIEALLP
ncbi:hypothetical protein AB0L96_31180 [Streptomyces sp. NPDC052115]